MPEKHPNPDMELAKALAGSATSMSPSERLAKAFSLIRAEKLQNLAPLLPLLLNLKGRPYNIDDYFPFEPFFKVWMPQKLLFMTARQVSKCIAPDSLIWMANGRVVLASEIRRGDEVLALGEDGRFQPAPVVRIWNHSDYRTIFRVATEGGFYVEATEDHRFLTPDGYVPLMDLAEGSSIAAIRRGGVFEDIPADRDRILIASQLAVSERWEALRVPADEQRRAKLAQAVERAGIPYREEDGIGDIRPWNRRLPAWVFSLSREDTALFLKELREASLDATGSRAFDQARYVAARLPSKLMAAGVQALFNKFGVATILRPFVVGPRPDFFSYQVEFAGEAAEKLAWQAVLNRDQGEGDPAAQTGEELPHARWEVVEDIVPLGPRQTLDFEVAGCHNFLVDGLVTHNSTSLAAQGIIQSICIPHFNTLYITPQYELTRRFSNNYVRAFIEESPMRNLLVERRAENSVLQRTFRNRSTMFFSFALLDATRTRGIPASKTCYDEAQSLNIAFIPIIREVMSASPWKLEQYTCTPLTSEGTAASLWNQSSQAEWVTKCQACGHWNIPAKEHDLDAMMGPDIVTREISEDSPGVVCAKCGKPIYPRTGVWVHRRKHLRGEFEGYHVPQCIMPMHYADPRAWRILLAKRRGANNTPLHVFYNECCGEVYDAGARLLTVADLRAAAVLHENKLEVAVTTIGNYTRRVLAVDWGGGGEDFVSFTTAAVLGLLPGGKIDVIFGWRSLTPHDHFGEARAILNLVEAFHCTHIVHDYSGAGASREALLASARFPTNRLIPVSYIRAASGPLMRFIPENRQTGQRAHYRVDKTRSLVMTIHLIRKKWIRFFAYDFQNAESPGLLHDFLSLMEEKRESAAGTDSYVIVRSTNAGPDDFAQAVNIGVCALYYQEGKWPDLSEIANLRLSQEQLGQFVARSAEGLPI